MFRVTLSLTEIGTKPLDLYTQSSMIESLL